MHTHIHTPTENTPILRGLRVQRIKGAHICIEVITRLFSYRPVYQARESITARGVAEGS